MNIPIRQSGVRPHLWLGCERQLLIVLVGICAWLILAVVDWIPFFIGLVLWFTGFAALRWLARLDPIFTKTFPRSRTYQSYYQAHSPIKSKKLPWRNRKRASINHV